MGVSVNINWLPVNGTAVVDGGRSKSLHCRCTVQRMVASSHRYDDKQVRMCSFLRQVIFSVNTVISAV